MASNLRRVFFSCGLACAFLCSSAIGQLRVVTYNTANGGENNSPSTPRSGMSTILEAIGNESRNGIAKPIDVLSLQEQFTSATTTQQIVDLLNSIHGPGTYARASINGATLGGGRPGLVYNTQTIELLGQTAFGTVNGSRQARATLRYQLKPVGYGADAEFYVYSNHYKASTGASNETRRNFEAIALRSNADGLGQGTHAIYSGDYNIQSSSEAMYQTLLASGNGQAFDPINRPGNWHNSSSFRNVHTQSPYDTAFNDPSLISGGMDDRFDFQLVTGEFLDDEGLSYINGSYRAFGNNGTHSLNDSINDNSNTAQPMNVLNALARVSDHLPVVADYQVPARMGVTLGTIPNRMLADAVIQMPVTVSNTANVVSFNGADELDYTITGLGAFSGTESGMDAALGSGNTHLIDIDTSTLGTNVGIIQVNSSSQAVADGSFSGSTNYTILDHANASFDGADDINSLTIDFGVTVPRSDQTESFSISNLLSVFAAGLDFDSTIEFGDAELTTDLAPFSNLPPGLTSNPFMAMLDTHADPGRYSATTILQFSDEDIPGVSMP
ncbi:MAG: hypothetical protein AAF497_24005, partial [Planctomycetota bacterium]